MSKKDFVATIYVFKHNFIVRKPNWNDCIAIIISTQGTNFKIEDENWGTDSVCPSFSVTSNTSILSQFSAFWYYVETWIVSRDLFSESFNCLSKYWLPQKKRHIMLSMIFFLLWVNFDVRNFREICWTRTKIICCLKKIFIDLSHQICFDSKSQAAPFTDPFWESPFNENEKDSQLSFVFVLTAKAKLFFF